MNNPNDKKRRPGFLKRYAQHAGIALSSAAEQLRRVGIDYMYEFDFADADRRREAARHADRSAFSKPIGSDPNAEEDVDPETKKHPKFIESQAEREFFKAKITELEYLVRIGELLESKEVDKLWFELTRLLRDVLLNIPPRIADMLAHENDPRKVQDLLEAELYQALEVLAANGQEAA